MAANVTPMPQRRDFDFTPGAVNIPDADADADQQQAALEGARRADHDDARTSRQLAPSPSRVTLIAGGVAAALFGGAVGYWLGSRRAPRTPAPVRHAASTADSLIDLAPVAMHLLGNPMVRTLALRLLLRQITSRLPG